MLALKARDEASAMLATVDGLLSKVSGTAGGATVAMDGVGSAMRTVGVIGLGVFTAIAGFFAMAEKAAAAFQSALTNVQNTANLTDAQTKALGKTLTVLAIGTTSSAVDMANALAPIAGEFQLITGHAINAADATSLLTAAQNLYVDKSVDLTAGTKEIVDLLRTYKLGAADAAAVTDALVQGSDLLGIGVETVAGSFTKLQPKIAGSGLSMQQLLGVVVEMGPAVGTGSRALMQVGTLIHALIVPSKAAATALTDIGVSLYDSQGNYIGAEAAIQKISVAYNALGTEAQKAALLQSIFGAQAGIAATLIAGGSAGLAKATAELEANGTAAQKAALKMQDADVQMSLLPKTMSDISTAIGMVLLPGLNRILSAILPVILGIGDWITQNPELTTTILAVAGAIGLLTGSFLIIGPVVGMIGTVVGVALSPFVLLGAGIAAVVLYMSQIPAVVEPFKALLDMLLPPVMALVGPLTNIGKAIFNLFTGKGDMSGFTASLGNLGTSLGNLGSSLPDTVKEVMGIVGAIGLLVAIISVAGPVGSAIGTIIGLLTGPVALVALGILAFSAAMLLIPSTAAPFRALLDSIWAGVTSL